LSLLFLLPLWVLPVTGEARADPPVPCTRVPDGTISVDGLRSDWKDLSPLTLAGGHALGGDKSRWQGKADLVGKLRCAHDGKGTYLLLEVNDDQVVRSRRYSTREDRVELLFPGARGKLRVLRIHPPNARFRKGRVRWASRPYRPKGIKSSVIRLRHGYAAELWIKSGAVPGYGVGTPKLKTTLRIVDHDGGVTRRPDTILVTGGITPDSLGSIEYDRAKALFAKFLRDKGLKPDNVLHHEVGNFITGEALEQLVIAGTWVAFIGEDVMKGGAYYAVPIQMAKTQQDMLRFRTLDLDGNGNLDVIIAVRQEGTKGLTRDLLVILRFLDAGKPDLYFASEIEVRHQGKVLTADYRFKPRRRGKGYALIMTVKKNRGWTQRNHRPTGGGRIENIPTPWGKKKRVYWFASDGYTER
jgi:hypothetical protein